MVFALALFATASPAAELRVAHVPLAAARHGNRDLAVRARISSPFLARAVWLRYRPVGAREFAHSEFRKSTEGEWIALVPRAIVTEPGFEYYIEGERKDGARVLHFASPRAPQRVFVRDRSEAARAAERLARHEGTRHAFSLSMGSIGAGVEERAGTDGTRRELADRYQRLEVGYVHRILSDAIYQIAFSFGILGAKLGAARPVADATGDGSLRTGLYLGRARATWELFDLVGLDLAAVLGANQSGFVAGGGGALRLGRLTGTHLELGAEYIPRTGYDAWVEFAWDTVPRLQMALRADFTTFPSADDGMAVLSSLNLRWTVTRNVFATAFIGYGTRFRYQRGGVSGGAGFGYQF